MSKPFWTNHCEHAEESFLGTTFGSRSDSTEEGTWDDIHDVYLFQSGNDLCLCFRYGEKPEEYISPPHLVELMLDFRAPDHYAPMIELARKEITKELIRACMARSIGREGERDPLFATMAAAIALGFKKTEG